MIVHHIKRRFVSIVLREFDAVAARMPIRTQHWYEACILRCCKSGVRLTTSSDGLPAVQEQDALPLHLAHVRRARRYRVGVRRQLAALLDSYCLEAGTSESAELGVVVDCGANCGELGVALRPDRYVAFEPDPSAYRALVANTAGDLFQMALGDRSGTLPLRLMPQSADSSLLGDSSWPSIDVPVERLDRVVEILGISSIDILKIEAEGFEPEVLKGAEGCLQICQTVVVDVGPERMGRDTAAACVDLMYSSGFNLVDTRMLSGRMRFERTIRSDP